MCKKLAIILINWNSFELTKDTLESLQQTTYTNYDCIIFYNNTSNVQSFCRRQFGVDFSSLHVCINKFLFHNIVSGAFAPQFYSVNRVGFENASCSPISIFLGFLWSGITFSKPIFKMPSLNSAPRTSIVSVNLIFLVKERAAIPR